MSHTISRKMGFMETVTTLIGHDRMAGSLSCAAMIKVQGHIDFTLFKQAWAILFQQQPMLRALRRIQDQEYFFDFKAQFANIPIQYIETTQPEIVDDEYSRNILKPFELSVYFWRATLIFNPEILCSHLLFAAPHSIVDGISMSWLLGDLLRTIIQLQEGQNPTPISLPIPPAIDTILDRSRFKPPSKNTEALPLPEVMPFHHKTDISNARSENLLRTLSATQLSLLLGNCRKHQVSLTGALIAALARSAFDLKHKTAGFFDVMIPFELRGYTIQPVPQNLLAFYAHQVLCGINIAPNQGFWEIAKQAQLSYQQAINEYSVPSADDHAVIENIFTRWNNKINNQEFLRPYSISNLGVIDLALKNTERYPTDAFYFTISQQALPNGVVLFAATVNHSLCLDFNYATPAFDKHAVETLADRFITYLVEL